MIRTFCNPPENSAKNQTVIVIDAGGTNFRTCLVTFDEKMKTIDLSQPGMVYRRENARFLLMCASMHDLMQEIEKKSDGRRGPHYLIEGTIEPDFEENREKLRCIHPACQSVHTDLIFERNKQYHSEVEEAGYTEQNTEMHQK